MQWIGKGFAFVLFECLGSYVTSRLWICGVQPAWAPIACVCVCSHSVWTIGVSGNSPFSVPFLVLDVRVYSTTDNSRCKYVPGVYVCCSDVVSICMHSGVCVCVLCIHIHIEIRCEL